MIFFSNNSKVGEIAENETINKFMIQNLSKCVVKSDAVKVHKNVLLKPSTAG